MKNIQSRLLCTALFSLYLLNAFAQQSTTASGGDATGSGGSAAYSIGQVLYNTQTGSNGSVAQGVQQPYEISIVLGTEVTEIDLNMAVYPNPTSDFLVLSCKNSLNGAKYYVSDINGNIIQTDKISDTQTTIHLNNVLSGTYLLCVNQNGQNIKIFKFIKN